MKQRARVKLVCPAVCVASGVLCALNRAPEWATVQLTAAMVVWRVRFAFPLQANDVNDLIATLRDTRNADEERPAMIRAVVTPNLIAVPSSATRWIQTAIAFRDEMESDRWRQLTTALRHQPNPAASATVTTKISRS